MDKRTNEYLIVAEVAAKIVKDLVIASEVKMNDFGQTLQTVNDYIIKVSKFRLSLKQQEYLQYLIDGSVLDEPHKQDIELRVADFDYKEFLECCRYLNNNLKEPSLYKAGDVVKIVQNKVDQKNT